MNNEKFKFIKASKIFSSLDDQTIHSWIPKFEEISLKKDQFLFAQGDASNYLYLLMSGRLSISLFTVSGDIKTISFVEPGQTVGELGPLSNEPRTFTAKAIQKSTLLRLSKKNFAKLCQNHPEITFSVIERTQETIRFFATEKIRRHIAIVAAHKDILLGNFSKSLAKYANKLSTILFMSDCDLEENPDTDLESKLENIINEIDKSKKPKRKLLYLLSSIDSRLAKLCLKKLDAIYILAPHETKPHIDDKLLAILKSHKWRDKIIPDLILLHPKKAEFPKNTNKWLALTEFNLHHQVREGHRNDYARLLRFVRGKAVGLVLGGGGTRGFAHLGAIKALREAKVPIDMIGGTSVGAIVAAFYAINSSFEMACDQFDNLVKESRNTVSWRNLTWPTISLFNAKKFTVAQKNAFDEILIENMWLPYFCVSCNFSQRKQEIHRRGLLWEKIRSTSSIPGLIPPMVINGKLHFDGGLLNNLPVDIMREFIGKHGKIVAVELVQDAPGEKKYHFPPILTLSDILLSKLKIRNNPYKFPPFIDTFLKAFLMGSSLKSVQNATLANLYININLEKYSILHSSDKLAKEVFEIGYKTASEEISKTKEIKSKKSSKKK